MRKLIKKYPVFLGLLVCLPSSIQAGAYSFASEGGINETLIVHPSNYTGSESIVRVRVCIDPASEDSSQMLNAADMEISVQNNINIFNQLQPTLGNVKLGANNDVASDEIDFESVALHEIGHCLGLAHINASSESGFAGNNQNYTKATDGSDNVFNIDAGTDGVIGSADDIRGDDGNLVWFRKSNNDPFTIDSIVDSSTYSLTDLPAGDNFAANADRSVSTLLGYVQTEAAMQQGTYSDEAQRTLGHDDVATLSYAQSGLDETAGTSDDYNVVLEYGGISATNCDISLKMTTTPGLAFCSASGESIGHDTQPRRNRVYNHGRMLNTYIEFGDSFNWFFNDVTVNQMPVLAAIGDQVVVEQDSLQININASDIDDDNLTLTVTGLPGFATFVDNGNGSATLTVSPTLGDASKSSVTITVSDDGLPVLNVGEVFQLDASALDTDSDGLGDYDEINIYGTLVNNPDTDGDFISDGVEINNITGISSDPLDALSFPNFADGDIAPLGSPDGLINAADYLLAQRIVLGDLIATQLELSHADLYPAGSPDGAINASDLILLLQLIQ